MPSKILICIDNSFYFVILILKEAKMDIKSFKELEAFVEAQAKQLASMKNVYSICEFFKRNSVEYYAYEYGIGDALRETSLFGFPSTAIFANKELCDGICHDISRIFAIYSMQPSARVCTAIDYYLAYKNYQEYKSNAKSAYHTWVEISIDGKSYAFDFSRQKVFFADDYRSYRGLNEQDIITYSVNSALLEEYTANSFLYLARRIAQYTNNMQTLLESMDNYIYKTGLEYDGSEMQQDLKFVCEEVLIAKERLQDTGLSEDYKSEAALIVQAIEDKNVHEMLHISHLELANQLMSENNCEQINEVYTQNMALLNFINSSCGPKKGMQATRTELFK